MENVLDKVKEEIEKQVEVKKKGKPKSEEWKRNHAEKMRLAHARRRECNIVENVLK